ncbi:universal stress protein [Micromonospora sp. WMMD1082]|uniref:universal stress protein n=1 Tax=Micromonospora sp. WMMD1082 TaxID=3016104 RepID=UPI00241622F3|nr:universal stress protein [Micromonospora sp. WMMD1082]MDG4797947.1 universal stress protein [Micromonospora sp. WMMD1082]
MTYLIVVGVDGSDGGRRALRWAVDEAAGRGGTVQAVTAWRWDGLDGGFMVAPNPFEEEERSRTLLARAVAEATRGSSAVSVAAEVVEGRPADVLSVAARGADLLVLGSHGHGRLRHTVLGSVSEECVRKATCPVVVIPVPAPAPTGTAVPALPG